MTTLRTSHLAAALAAVSVAACSGDGSDTSDPLDPADASVDIDADVPADAPDVSPDAPDVPPDAPPGFVTPTPFAVPLSAGGPDQLQSAAPGPNGTFYAAGFAAWTVSGTRWVTVVKMTPTGPDTNFGVGGVVTTSLDFRGASDEIDIRVQPSGKIIVSATVANATNPADNDIAVLRLNTNGTLDTSFGVGGIRVLDLSTALPPSTGTTLVGRDGARGLAIHPTDGRIYVHGYQRGEDAGNTRTDTDFALVRLSADGAIDPTFGDGDGFTDGDGTFLLDLERANPALAKSGATARGLHVFEDGSVVAAGYANSVTVGSTQPVLYRLTSAGALDTNFSGDGLFYEAVLAVQTEAYGFAVHGSGNDYSLVTGGYGRNAGTTNDWVALRFDAETGQRQTAWGPSGSDGKVVIDPSGAMLGSNCRGAYALPGGRTLLLGSTGPGNMPAQDAAIAILDHDGILDPAFGDGVHTFALGANGNDQFWGAAVNGDYALVVGYQGGGATQTESMNDNSYGVLLRLP